MTELDSVLMFYLIGLLGMLAHWAKRWLRSETKTSLWAYLFTTKPKYTAYALLTYTGAVFFSALTMDLNFASKEALLLALTTGYTIDSAINKDFQDEELHRDVRSRF